MAQTVPICLTITGPDRAPRTYLFDQDEITLGRSLDNDLIFDPEQDIAVSRKHCTIHRTDGCDYTIKDYGSTQGTYVNNACAMPELPLMTRDRIRLGIEGPKIDVVFERDDESMIESSTIIQQRHAVHFPLVLHRGFPERFQEYERIGEGGYGQVWKARARNSTKWVAIKYLRPELLIHADTETSVQRVERLAERFQREAEVMIRLYDSGAHGVARVLEAGGDPLEGFVYMILELVEGQSLDRVIAHKALLEQRRVCRYMYHVATTLAAAHNFEWVDPAQNKKMRGVVHRDVKPSNIIIRRADDRAILCDFGIAAVEEGGERLTLPMVRVFTHKYTAPEVMRTNSITPATDVWGLSVVAYALLTRGKYPYGGMGMAETIKAIELRKLTPITMYRDDLSDDFVEFLEQALEPDPDKRLSDAQEWADRIREFV